MKHRWINGSLRTYCAKCNCSYDEVVQFEECAKSQPEAPRESRGEEQDEFSIAFPKHACHHEYRKGFNDGCRHVRSQQKPEACQSAEEAAEKYAKKNCDNEGCGRETFLAGDSNGYARAKTELEEARKRIADCEKREREAIADCIRMTDQLAERDKIIAKLEIIHSYELESMGSIHREGMERLGDELIAASSKIDELKEAVMVYADKYGNEATEHDSLKAQLIDALFELSPAEPTKDEQKGVGK